MASWSALWGFAFVFTALATIATFAWQYPTQDQFRLYRNYLEYPFPQNVMQVENQHRPIVPGLVRVAEIHLRDADQQLQIAFGVGCALATVLLLSLISLRTTSLAPGARWAAVAAACLAVFWLGNARMLLHGNELVHTYLVALAAVAVALCAWRAACGASLRWLAAGSVAAAIATFSFGPGVALFPTLALLAATQRVPWRATAIPLLACGACLLLYVFVLPGNDNVRLALAFRPWDSVLTATRWLASPWINAWLGFGDPPMYPMHAELIAAKSAWLVESADAVQRWSGLTWAFGLALLLGVAGLGVLAAALWQALRARAALSLPQVCGLTLMLFGAACAAIIGIARVAFMLERPDQVFADRYLPWPCLFWLGVGLWLLASRARMVRGAAVAFIALLPIALWPTHELGAGWGASVFRGVQATAAAARSDVLDPDVLWREDPSALFEDKLRSLQLFRERGLAMFAEPGTRALGAMWTVDLDADAGAVAPLSVTRAASDVRGPVSAVRVEGMLAAVIEPGRVLAVLDPTQRIVGYGEPSFDPDGESPLRWWPKRLRGFDAFIRGYDPGVRYRVAALDFASRTGIVVGELAPVAAAQDLSAVTSNMRTRASGSPPEPSNSRTSSRQAPQAAR